MGYPQSRRPDARKHDAARSGEQWFCCLGPVSCTAEAVAGCHVSLFRLGRRLQVCLEHRTRGRIDRRYSHIDTESTGKKIEPFKLTTPQLLQSTAGIGYPGIGIHSNRYNKRLLAFFSLARSFACIHETLMDKRTTEHIGKDSQNRQLFKGQCVFFVVAPFCSCPASLVSRNFFAVGPGCAKCFVFCCAPLGAATFRGGQAKKNTTQGVFFFCSGPGERQGKEKPRWAPARGQSKKKNTTQGVFFFAPAPGKGRGRRSPVGRRHGARAKKKTPPARGFSFPCLSPKKNTLGGVLFFAAAPRGRSLTHCGPGWRCLPLAGVFFFLLRPRPDRGGVCFFAVAPPGLSLTHCGLGRFRQGPGGVFFFAAAPPGLFRQ